MPEVLVVEDIAGILRISRGAARALIRRGVCGPYSRLGRRLVVRREAFLEARRRSEVTPALGGRGRRVPRPRPETMELLRGSGRRRK